MRHGGCTGIARPSAPSATEPMLSCAIRIAGERRSLLRTAAMLGAIGLLSIVLPGSAADARDDPPATAPGNRRFAEHVAEAARRFGIPEAWIWAIMRAESGGDPNAISKKSAMGLMQIVPTTWAYLSARHNLGAKPYDPRNNIIGGTAYLRELHDRYGSPGFLAAYNAGPGRYEEFRDVGRPLPAETVAYVTAISPTIGAAPLVPKVVADPLEWTRADLFVARSGTSIAPGSAKPGDMPAEPTPALASSDTVSADKPRDGLFVAQSRDRTPQ